MYKAHVVNQFIDVMTISRWRWISSWGMTTHLFSFCRWSLHHTPAHLQITHSTSLSLRLHVSSTLPPSPPPCTSYYGLIAGEEGWWWVKQWPTKDQTLNSCLIYLCTCSWKLIAAHYEPSCTTARMQCFPWTVDRKRFYSWHTMCIITDKYQRWIECWN